MGVPVKLPIDGVLDLHTFSPREIKDLDVDSIPLNFLNPIPGTPLAGMRDLTPFLCLKIVAMMRLCHPAREIIVAYVDARMARASRKPNAAENCTR